MNSELEMLGRKWSCLAFCLEVLRKPQVSASVSARIRTENFMNTSVKRYRHANSLSQLTLLDAVLYCYVLF
jgi:hypothetical protein